MEVRNKVTVIIVNWNTKNLLDGCLNSVHAYMPNCETIVVDNGSHDGSVDLIREKYPEVKPIINTDNLGFGTANNKAIKIASGEYILFLNTDVIITNNSIEKLIMFMDKNPKAGLCTPTLLKEDGSMQDTFGPMPSVATELFRGFTRRKGISNLPKRVESIRGAYMLARNKALKDVGGFSEEYFLFMEETDLCLKLNNFGWQTWWIPDTCVYHKGGGSAVIKQPNARIEYWRSRYIFFRKYYSKERYIIFSTLIFLKLIIDLCLNLIAAILTLFQGASYKKKLKNYMILLFWHILGRPGAWGIGSENTIRIDAGFVKRGFEGWYRENRGRLFNTGLIIKENARRRLVDYGDNIFIKVYKTTLLNYFLYKLGKTPPWLNEWRLANRLRQFDIPTINPIATGYKYIVTEKLNNISSLHNYILENKDSMDWNKKLDMVSAFAEFINKVHRKGLYHCDLHPGNIVISKDVFGFKFYITDLHRAGLKIYLSKRDRIDMLIGINIFFSLQVSPKWRMRFFKYYFKKFPLGRDYKYYIRLIEKRTNYFCQKLWQKHDRIYLKRDKFGLRGIYNKTRYIINPRYKKLDIPAMFQQISSNSGRVIKDSRSSYILVLNINDIGEVVLKRYRQKRIINYLKDIFRHSKGFKSYCNSLALLDRGIACPEPILAGEDRFLGILKGSFIISRNISNSENLTLWILNNWKDKSFLFKKDFIKRLASFVKTIHKRGVTPCDLKACNILVKDGSNRIDFYLIDLDHIHKGRDSRKERLYNLAQMNRSFPSGGIISSTMRWRFLKEYFKDKDKGNIKKIARRLTKQARLVLSTCGF